MDFATFWQHKEIVYLRTTSMLQMLRHHPAPRLNSEDLRRICEDVSSLVAERHSSERSDIHIVHNHLPLAGPCCPLDFDTRFLEPLAESVFDDFFYSEDSLDRLSGWRFASLPEEPDAYTLRDYTPSKTDYAKAETICANVCSHLELYEMVRPNPPWQNQ